MSISETNCDLLYPTEAKSWGKELIVCDPLSLAGPSPDDLEVLSVVTVEAAATRGNPRAGSGVFAPPHPVSGVLWCSPRLIPSTLRWGHSLSGEKNET